MRSYIEVPTDEEPFDDIGFDGEAAAPAKSKRRQRAWGRHGVYAIVGLGVVSVLYLLVKHDALGLLSPVSSGTTHGDDGADMDAQHPEWSHDFGRHGEFPRDPTPIDTAQRFLAIAEAEVAALGLYTCDGELGRTLVDEAAEKRVTFCSSDVEEEDDAQTLGHNTTESEEHDAQQHGHAPRALYAGEPGADKILDLASHAGASITCTPIRVEWWPVRSVSCLSRGLWPVTQPLGEARKFLAPRCNVTAVGRAETAGAEKEGPFIGNHLLDRAAGKCKELLRHTVMFIRRQDQWNPFHVGEDLVMTFISLLIAGATDPTLVHDRIQLAFIDNYQVTSNRYDALWGRIGAIAPRRTRVDPYHDGTCLTRAIHGMNGGRSLFSAMGVDKSYTCASTLAWASSLYYRHLYGLASSSPPQQPINVLYMSRANLRNHDGVSFGEWQQARVLLNEPEMVARMKRGLRELCDDERGELNCSFDDADEYPETWFDDTPAKGGRIPLRFATIDPSGYSVNEQIPLVARATVLVSQHSGALGLSLFLRPGTASIVELLVPSAGDPTHYQHMAYEMGHTYNMVSIYNKVQVDNLWDELRPVVLAQAAKPHRTPPITNTTA